MVVRCRTCVCVFFGGWRRGEGVGRRRSARFSLVASLCALGDGAHSSLSFLLPLKNYCPSSQMYFYYIYIYIYATHTYTPAHRAPPPKKHTHTQKQKMRGGSVFLVTQHNNNKKDAKARKTRYIYDIYNIYICICICVILYVILYITKKHTSPTYIFCVFCQVTREIFCVRHKKEKNRVLFCFTRKTNEKWKPASYYILQKWIQHRK